MPETTRRPRALRGGLTAAITATAAAALLLTGCGSSAPKAGSQSPATTAPSSPAAVPSTPAPSLSLIHI